MLGSLKEKKGSFLKLSFSGRGKNHRFLPVELFLLQSASCCVEENTVLDIMKHKFSIYPWPKLHE